MCRTRKGILCNFGGLTGPPGLCWLSAQHWPQDLSRSLELSSYFKKVNCFWQFENMLGLKRYGFWSLLSGLFGVLVFSPKVSVRQEAGLCPALHSLVPCTAAQHQQDTAKYSPATHNRLPGWDAHLQMPWVPSHCRMSPQVSFLWAVRIRGSSKQEDHRMQCGSSRNVPISFCSEEKSHTRTDCPSSLEKDNSFAALTLPLTARIGQDFQHSSCFLFSISWP